MKNIILYTIVFLFSIAFCNETVDYFYQKAGTGTFCSDLDPDCEEGHAESEAPVEKAEKTDPSDKLFSDKDYLILITENEQQVIKSHIHFFSCDYSKVIYSPPEYLFL